MSDKFNGVYTALITPFKNQEVDFNSLKNLIEFQKARGIEGFVVNGTTAESPTLEESEVLKIFEFVKENFSGKVIVGTGSNSTKKTMNLTQKVKTWGADGALVVTPYYNKPTQEGLFLHFKAIAESTELPIMLYNVPARTITSLSVETVKKLSKIKNIIGVKEAKGDMSYSRELLGELDQDFSVLSGDDITCFDQNMLGGVGVISVASHVIPEKFIYFDKMSQSKDDSYISEFKKFMPLIQNLFSVANPIPVKMALKLMGIIESAELRLPLTQLDEQNTNNLKEQLTKFNLI